MKLEYKAVGFNADEIAAIPVTNVSFQIALFGNVTALIHLPRETVRGTEQLHHRVRLGALTFSVAFVGDENLVGWETRYSDGVLRDPEVLFWTAADEALEWILEKLNVTQ